MKTLLVAVSLASASLAGCAVVPLPAGPVVYRSGPYWRHGWR